MSQNQFAWTFPGGKPKQEVTSVTVVNNIAKTTTITVPAGKIWLIYIIKVTNPDDVGRNVTIDLWKEAAKTNLIAPIIAAWPVDAFGTGARTDTFIWPSANHYYSFNAASNALMLLVVGNILEIILTAGGASAGGTDADAIVISYLEIDAP